MKMEIVTDSNHVILPKINMAVDMRYKYVKTLGSGTYGIVCSFTDSYNPTNRPIAIKKVTNVFTNKILVKRALREVVLLVAFRGNKNVGPIP